MLSERKMFSKKCSLDANSDSVVQFKFTLILPSTVYCRFGVCRGQNVKYSGCQVWICLQVYVEMFFPHMFPCDDSLVGK